MRQAVLKILVFLIRFYRTACSPFLPPACRYQPTCSEFAGQAIEKYGAMKGSWLALKRIASCHPWGGHGFDPVP